MQNNQLATKQQNILKAPYRAFFIDKKLYLFCLIICLFGFIFVPLLYRFTISKVQGVQNTKGYEIQMEAHQNPKA